ncbi:MAG: PQQ-like beta-propeller repeat protein [Phycisphaerales bacterium]|nr:PQQ-like beta-propeller repeat protein [Phycisphaerales bacterium]
MKIDLLATRYPVIGCLIACGTASAQLADTPWPKWQRDYRNSGWTPAVGPSEPRISWKHAYFGQSAEPGVAIGPEGELYVSWHIFGQPVCQMNLGEESWRWGFVSRVTRDGDVSWFKPVRDLCFSFPTLAQTDAVYVVDGEYSYQLSRSHVYAFTRDALTSWGPRQYSQASDYTYGYLAVGRDGTLYYPEASTLYAIHPSDGSLKWQRTTAGDWIFRQCPSIGEDGTVYVAHGARSQVPAELWALDPQNGALRWKVADPQTGTNTSGTSIGLNGTIYLTFRRREENLLTAVSPEGEVLWQTALAGSPDYAPSIDSRGRLYLCTLSETTFGTLLESYDHRGEQRWVVSIHGSGGHGSNPIVIDGRNNLYVNTPDYQVTETNKLMSFTSGGDLRWEFTSSLWLENQAPVMGPDGTIYLMIEETPEDGLMHLYAFGPGEAPDPAWVGRLKP